jgi:predicted house-cleaning noncanonical NTP pyrophosphatase (MazG superfamily)
MVKVYNKLVRDRIPEIIEKDNKTCKTRILSDEEYMDYLNQKLNEELKEYQEEHDIHELADVQEIINAIVKAKHLTLKEFDSLREAKKETNGGFDKKIFLESVDDGK